MLLRSRVDGAEGLNAVPVEVITSTVLLDGVCVGRAARMPMLLQSTQDPDVAPYPTSSPPVVEVVVFNWDSCRVPIGYGWGPKSPATEQA